VAAELAERDDAMLVPLGMVGAVPITLAAVLSCCGEWLALSKNCRRSNPDGILAIAWWRLGIGSGVESGFVGSLIGEASALAAFSPSFEVSLLVGVGDDPLFFCWLSMKAIASRTAWPTFSLACWYVISYQRPVLRFCLRNLPPEPVITQTMACTTSDLSVRSSVAK